MIDLDDLRKRAEAATPGPWVQDVDDDVMLSDVYTDSEGEQFRERWEAQDPDIRCHEARDATHISAFDPPTILALIDRCEAVEAAVARVRALHKPAKYPLGTGSVCEECTRIQRDTDLTLTGGAWADSCFTSYPCATISALDGEDA